ncbi:MAG: lamin tail domain-containing protein, partial [Bacteroidota bacterium]
QAEPYVLKAIFEPFNHPLSGELRINELSPTADWLEIHNASAETVNLHGWQLTDGLHTQRLPDIELAPDAYLLLAEDAFTMEFGLAKEGETLGLYAPDGAFVDRMTYRVDDPPEDFVLLPSGEEWRLESGPGTPGAANPVTVISSVGRADFWWRIIVGGGILGLVILVRIMTASRG